MKIFLLFFLIIQGIICKSQVIYLDPAVSSAQLFHAGIMDSELNATKRKLTLIQRGQIAVATELKFINDIQEKLLKGLSEVNTILNNLANAREIGRIAKYIAEDLNQIMDIAQKNPLWLAFAEESARTFHERARNLALEVSTFILKGGINNLMDSGERTKLINNVYQQMLLLRGLSCNMYLSMSYAQKLGFLKAINPFQGYANTDMKIMKDIIGKYKRLK